MKRELLIAMGAATIVAGMAGCSSDNKASGPSSGAAASSSDASASG